jgi:hypothetical protein
MKYLKKTLHFLGSLYFAIILILSTAIFVLAGTLLEASTESHLYASYFTYNNPFFIFLLWGFFVNILLSTLRRWPFKVNHIPFIITHIGLLMILGGSLTKSYKGVQGSMGIIEGGGSDEILVPNSYALSIDKKIPFTKSFVSLIPEAKLESPFPELRIEVLEFCPHCLETFEIWPESKGVADVLKSAEQAYIDSTLIHLKDSISEKTVFEGYLADMVDRDVPFAGGSIKLQLHFNFANPALKAEFALHEQKKLEGITVPLDGEHSLTNFNLSSPYLGALPFSVDIQRSPTLLFLKDSRNDTYLFSFDPFGRVHSQTFRKDNLTSLMEYDNGFGGYTVQANIPIHSRNCSRLDLEKIQIDAITHELKQSLATDTLLSPPLKLLKEACEKTGVDFADTCIAFLREWNYSHGWLHPNRSSPNDAVEKALAQVDWDAAPLQVKNGCILSSLIFQVIEEDLKNDRDLIATLTSLNWPLVNSLKTLKSTPGAFSPGETELILTHLVQQVFSAGHLVPEFNKDGISNTRLLSAYMRLHGIHWNSIEMPPRPAEENLAIESPIRIKHLSAAPLKKLEDNTPKISLKLSENGESENITLSFDRYGMGLKWPAMKGKYRLRFQPLFVKIPYRLRLRQARQINYPNSSQPYSYESDLIVTDSTTGQQIEKTISMNNVFETWDGYRFYLANIVPADEGAVKRVQIVVNYDPAKYWLTYPGCMLLVLGIILLFWFKKPGIISPSRPDKTRI